jgi:formate--tetrahydrofolate ligase
MRSSLEIANAARVAPIADVAEQAGIPTQFVEPYGRHKAKIDLDLLKQRSGKCGPVLVPGSSTRWPAACKPCRG